MHDKGGCIDDRTLYLDNGQIDINLKLQVQGPPTERQICIGASTYVTYALERLFIW